MSGLLSTPLVVVVLDNDKQPFAVWEDFDAHVAGYFPALGGVSLMVPAGFATDFASIPAPLRQYIDKVGKHCKAALLHDFLYWTQTCSRAAADLTFFNAMAELGVSPWKKWAMYIGVRAAGWWVWNNRRTQL